MRTFGMAVFGAGLVLALACGYSTGPTYNNPGSTDPGSGSQSHNTPSISVNDGFFTPSVDTVAVNTTVTWTWVGSGHTVTFEDGLTSDLQSSGATYTRTFSAAGTYRYRCTVHSTNFTSGMIGTVVVQ